MKESIVLENVAPVTLKRFSVMRILGTVFLKAFGWRIEGHAPDLPKCVAIFAYHTSNWDGVFAMAEVRIDDVGTGGTQGQRRKRALIRRPAAIRTVPVLGAESPC